MECSDSSDLCIQQNPLDCSICRIKTVQILDDFQELFDDWGSYNWDPSKWVDTSRSTLTLPSGNGKPVKKRKFVNRKFVNRIDSMLIDSFKELERLGMIE